GVLERPGPEAVEEESLFFGIGFKETGDGRLDALVIDRWAHQLERAVEVGDPDPGTVTADLENELEVGPAHVVEGHALVLGSGGSGRSGEGARHGASLSRLEATGDRAMAVFFTAHGAIPFEPAATRVFVRFIDAASVSRGATRVAVAARERGGVSGAAAIYRWLW